MNEGGPVESTAAAPSRATVAYGRLFVVVAMLYAAGFLILQTPGLLDRGVLEWDARGFSLHAFRFHGTGLFPGDFIVDAAKRYDTPVWCVVYWLGSLVTDPFEVSKVLPFLLFGCLLWQAYALGREHGGAVLGAACVIAVVHCTPFWNRIVGGNPRAFGFPLVVALLRYASLRAERRSLLVLFLQGLAYPSALLCCAPAYVLVAARRGRGPCVRALLVSLVAVVCAAASLWGDARMGSPPTYAQAAGLAQMKPGGAQPYYPLAPFVRTLVTAAQTPFRSQGEGWRGFELVGVIGLLALVAAGLLAVRATKLVPRPARGDLGLFITLPLAGLVAAGAAQLLAYRFYLPDRELQLAWIPAAALGLPLLLGRAFTRPLVAAALSCAILFGAGGDGLPIAENLTDFTNQRTSTIRFLSTLPKDVLIAAHPERSSSIQIFALRRTLFSSSLNMTFLYEYARELERRFEAYYRAYYAPDVRGVLALRRVYGVDYLLVDDRDFGPDAARRARYYEPWGTLTAQLLGKGDPMRLALAEPPAVAVVWASVHQRIVDLRKLEALDR